MAIYCKYGDIKGAVTTDGFKDWIELNSFQWGASRHIGTAARGATTREHSEPSLSEVTVTKLQDVSSPKLFLDSVAGKMDNKVTIKTVKLGPQFGDMWVVESGLQLGDTVIVDGLQRVRTGMTVAPTPFRDTQANALSGGK